MPTTSADKDYRIKLPRNVLNHVRIAEGRGHRLVSQGCARFRCEGCNETDFLDVYNTFRNECPHPIDRLSQFR